MTRENLIKAVFDAGDICNAPKGCPFYNNYCGDSGHNLCMECAKSQLAEYESTIRADALNVLLARATDKAIDTEVGKFIHMNELRLIVEQMGGDKND